MAVYPRKTDFSRKENEGMKRIKEMVIAFFLAPFELMKSGGVLEIVVSLLLLVCYLAGFGLAGYGTFHVADSWWLPMQNGVGVVQGKGFTPAWTQTILIYNAATKTSLPSLVPHPDRWDVTFEVNGDTDSIEVSSGFYNSVSEGDRYVVDYVSGRIRGGLYLRGITE